ncbi:MAG TPA: sarcosine oxidase subunit gamma family protein [Ensifer sp.]|jgi:sarcosine oxidase subunit gamma|uniref:sarcosine oxidase subunit gamma n=1 Tax=Ensifer sp. TaxID=1872086 RepID=UPI002E10640D|nr:sarcosine oxidase subunit gamma family protein [Ensifer sp.]
MVRDYNNRHALEQKLRAAPTQPSADHLMVGHWRAVATVLARSGQEETVRRAIASVPEFSMRYCAPAEWLVISEAEAPSGLARRLEELCGAMAHVVDQSDGRVVFRLSGPNGRRILAKGIGLDLHPDAFSLGGSANVLCGHIPVNLGRTGEHVFELIVPRSFAESLFDDLMRMGREFDLTAAFAD